MGYKKNRKAKVYGASVPGKKDGLYGTTSYKTVPQIKLTGLWLEELGFEPGTQMNIECLSGQLIITKADEVIVDEISTNINELY